MSGPPETTATIRQQVATLVEKFDRLMLLVEHRQIAALPNHLVLRDVVGRALELPSVRRIRGRTREMRDAEALAAGRELATYLRSCDASLLGGTGGLEHRLELERIRADALEGMQALQESDRLRRASEELQRP